MSPISNATNVGYVKGRIEWTSLKLTMGGPENGGWEENHFCTMTPLSFSSLYNRSASPSL